MSARSLREQPHSVVDLLAPDVLDHHASDPRRWIREHSLLHEQRNRGSVPEAPRLGSLRYES
jgi:hypothetical protein